MAYAPRGLNLILFQWRIVVVVVDNLRYLMYGPWKVYELNGRSLRPIFWNQASPEVHISSTEKQPTRTGYDTIPFKKFTEIYQSLVGSCQ